MPADAEGDPWECEVRCSLTYVAGMDEEHMKAVKFFVCVILIFCAVAVFGAMPAVAQDGDDPDGFEDNGCRVPEEFLDFVESHGGIEIFGYPISNPFRQRGVVVQYFQNARIESHPSNPDPYKVQLGLLGDELNYRDEPISRPRLLSSRRHYFPETGHVVSYAFLDFFKDNGGIDVFGFPITEMHYEDGRIVQYFQRLKMEWHPRDTRQPVHVGNMGEIYFDTYKENFLAEAFCEEGGPPTSPRSMVQELEIEVDVKYPVMTKRTKQEVSVLVKDGNGNAISEVDVQVSLIGPSGRILSLVTDAPTNERGLARVTLPVEGASRGDNITAEAVVIYDGIEASKEIVFLVWW